MKKQLITACIVALATAANAQWSTGCPINTTCNVSIGTTNSTISKLYVVGVNVGVRGDATSNNFAYATQGVANGVSGSGLAIGLTGLAGGGSTNYGAYITGVGNSGGGGVSAIGVYGQVNNPSAGDWAGYFNGNVFCSGSYSSSDRKLKSNIQPFTNALDKINLLKPSTYTFKTDEFKDLNLPKGNQIGLIAQDLETVFPDLVQQVSSREQRNEKGEMLGRTTEFKSVNYTSLIPVLIAGIQEQQQQMETYAKDNSALKAQVADLQNQVAALMNDKTSTATGINQLNNNSNGATLGQNIPNPFSQETTINYTLPSQIKNATLAVYDLSGKQVSSFALNQGSSSITLTSDKLAAGIYIYSVMADGKILDSKRMVVAQKQ